MKIRILLLIVSIILNSCVGYTRISFEEQKSLLEWSRNYALENCKDLTENDKDIIVSDEPQWLVYYTGYKYGQFFLKWKSAPSRTVVVYGCGMLDNKESITWVKVEEDD